MNWDRIEGKWKQFRGKVKERWGKLRDDDLDTIRGKREQLVGRVQEVYGIAKDRARKQVDEFVDRLFEPKDGRVVRVRVQIVRRRKSRSSVKSASRAGTR
jgi:uncharacterized protein YjbJ (UPF0337 family)